MNILKKLFVLIIYYLIASLASMGQTEDCYDKTIASIYLNALEEEVVNLLNEKYGEKTPEEWRDYIDSRIVDIMQKWHSEIEFSSYRENPGIDPHYFIYYVVAVIAIDGEMIIPSIETNYVDPITGWQVTEWSDPEFESLPAYWIASKMVMNSPCVPNRRRIIAVEISKDVELEQSIKNNAGLLSPLYRKVLYYEKDHPVPPRGPELEIEFEKKYLSIVNEDDREVEITGKVKNCLGEYVTDGTDGASIYFQKEVNRLEFRKAPACCADGPPHGDFHTILTNNDYEARGRYKVIKGIDASRETIKFGTCGIRTSSEYYIERELVIRGLEIKVKPDRTQVYYNENTDIRISLNETDPDDNTFPVKGKEIKLTISGVNNGTITPSDKYITDEFGEVILHYHAGDNDERIRITASFQPENYPEKTEDRASISVKPHEYEATLVLKGRITKRTISNESEERTEGSCHIQTVKKQDAHEYVEAVVHMNLKRKEIQDMPILNQTFEYYTPVSVTLESFSYNSKEHKYDHSDLSGQKCASGGHVTTTDYLRNAMNFEIDSKEYVTQFPWMVVFDNESGKAVKMLPAGFNISYKINESEKIYTLIWSKEGRTEDSHSSNKIISKTFQLGPVGDKVPDPTVKTSDQWIQEYLKQQGVQIPAGVNIPQISNKETKKDIQPDILVKSGDGKTYFGGDATKIITEKIPNGTYQEERFYSWQMTRKKK